MFVWLRGTLPCSVQAKQFEEASRLYGEAIAIAEACGGISSLRLTMFHDQGDFSL